MAESSVPSEPPPDYESAVEHGAQLAPPRQGTPARKGPLPPPLPLELPILTYLKSKRVILASASPRRKALLSQIGLTNVEIFPSTKPENLSKTEYGPYEYVAATARQKCLDVYQAALAQQEEMSVAAAGKSKGQVPPPPADPELVIAADTVIVTRAGQILEKPRSEADHVRMLRYLRDTRVHRVLTSVCVIAPRRDASHPGYEMAAHTEETKVFFVPESGGLPDSVVEAYVRTREGADKAGGYAVQGTGGIVLVERVEGSVDNVVGLPVRQVLRLAEKVVFHQGEEEDEEDDDSEGAAL